MANKIVNTFETGLVRLDNKTKQPKNSYSYALNAVPNDEITDRTSKTNERGFDEYIKIKEDPYNIIGYQWLGDEEYVFFIKDLEGHTAPFNEIWYVDIKEELYELKYSNLGLNFREGYPITSTYRSDYRNHRLIYWVDGLNDDRVIDIDDPDVSSLDLSRISLSSSEISPNISVTAEDTGGVVKSGQYFVAVAYKDENNFVTGASNFTKPVSIAVSRYGSIHTITEGSELDVVTSKKLLIEVKDIDPKYSDIIIYIVQVTDTKTVIYTSHALKVNSGSREVEFEFTGLNLNEDTTISINDLVVPRINYYASNIINQKENRLIRGNFKSKENLINYQQIANNIVVNYEIEEKLANNGLNLRKDFTDHDIDNRAVESGSYNNYKLDTSYLLETGNSLEITSKTFMRDEVYALGISFELNDGTETDVFHIPGRTHNSVSAIYENLIWGEYFRDFNALNSPNWDTDMVSGQPRWLERNTAIKRRPGTPTNIPNQLAYWRSDSIYPDGYGYPTDGETDSTGKSYIRHHKMPSDVLEPIYRTEIIGQDSQDIGYKVYTRYIKLVLNNIVIPQEYQDIITKINFHYVKRDDSNKSIVSKGLIYNTDTFLESNGAYRNSPQLNYFYNSALGVYQFISPDIDFRHKNFPITANRFRAGYVSKGYVSYLGKNVGLPFNYYTRNMVNTYLYYLNATNPPYTQLLAGTTMYVQNTMPIETDYQMYIDSIQFTDANSIGSLESSIGNLNYDFRGESPSSIFRKTAVSPNLIVDYSDYNSSLNFEESSPVNLVDDINYAANQTGNPGYSFDEIYYDSVFYGSLIRDNRLQYGNNPTNLVYIDVGTSIQHTGSGIYNNVEIKNGDSFIDIHYTKKGYSINNTIATYQASVLREDGITQGVSPIGEIQTNFYIAYIAETDLNIKMRNSDPNIPENGMNYFPISPLDTGVIMDSIERKATGGEYFNIYPSYNNLSIKEYFANNKTLQDFNDSEGFIAYPNRLVYSDKQNYEDKLDSFRITRANNYRDIPMDRGQITQSFIKEDNLFVLTRDALFNVYASNKALQTVDGENMTVGTGEFFGLEPVELISIKGGFGGTSSKFSLIESPYGYLFVDVLKDKIILYNDTLKDINAGGLKEDFKLNLLKQFKDLQIPEKFDNPILGPGIISIYDPKLHRIIITKKDYIGLEDITDNYQGIFDPEADYSIGDIVAKDGVLVEITDKIDTYPAKWIASGQQCQIEGVNFNTGYVEYTTLLKVSDDVNEYPLDVDNVRTSESGLPQDSKPNSPIDIDYIAPVLDTVTCVNTTPVTFINTDSSNTVPEILLVDTDLNIYINSVYHGTMFGNQTEVLNLKYGDVVEVVQGTNTNGNPWPPSSTALLEVERDSTVDYTNTETVQSNPLDSHTFTVLEQVPYTVTSTGSTTTTGWRTYDILTMVTTAVPPVADEVLITIIDNTNSFTTSRKRVVNNTSSQYNCIDDAGTVDIRINNESAIIYTVNITNGTVNDTMAVNPSTAYTFEDLPKSDYTITIS